MKFFLSALLLSSPIIVLPLSLNSGKPIFNKEWLYGSEEPKESKPAPSTSTTENVKDLCQTSTGGAVGGKGGSGSATDSNCLDWTKVIEVQKKIKEWKDAEEKKKAQAAPAAAAAAA